MHFTGRFYIFILLTSFLSGSVFSQISDDFSDGDFTSGTVWQGDTGNFIVNASGELQLFAPDAGMSLIMSQGNIPDSVIWKFDLRMEFAPSASNLSRVWLQASENSNNADGYFLELGENGSLDAVRFFRQQAGSTTLLATGLASEVAGDPVDIRIEMKRSAAGDWQLWLAHGSADLVLQFTVNDITFTGADQQWFGFYCLYTATRKDKFYFDNISVQPDLPDQQPPVLLSANAIDAQTVVLSFDEKIDSTIAVNPGAYLLNGVIVPVSATWSSLFPNAIQLSFALPFQNGQQHTISATGIIDNVGNVANIQEVDFLFLVAEESAEFDILINEIMSDPSPSVGLPATAEWLELYNRSTKYIQLSSLTITDGGGVAAPLPEHMMLPGEYLVLCTPASKILLSGNTANTLGMSDFPSLNNDGELLTLKNTAGIIVSQVNFTPDWHTDAAKKDGGWSLERINPEIFCLGKNNWQSCPEPPGGSPGAINFSYSNAPDITAPTPLQTVLTNTTTLTVTFSEGLDPATVPVISNYSISPTLEILSAAAPVSINEIQLTFAQPPSPGILYSLTFKPTLTDCSGNAALSTDTLRFGIAQTPVAGDIVINEILFNPVSGGSRFVEIYNKSGKIFELAGFSLKNYASTSSTATVSISTNRLLLPGEFLTFTSSTADISSRFENVDPAQLVAQNMPSLDDKTGNISLLWSAGSQVILLDSFEYSNTYHNALLSVSDQEGISLERIRIDGPTNDPANWTSAAKNGSPTRPNGQRGAGTSNGDIVSLSATQVSPDGDGYEDYLDILFNLPGSGYAANMTIYDSEGLVIKKLLNQDISSPTGTFRWDADDNNGVIVRPGIYILFLEIYNATGNLQQVKKPFSVVGRF